LVLLPAIILLFASHAAAATNVAVFNFQMKSDTADWRWLEKGLSDRIATTSSRAGVFPW
jgi:TolB-like protein